MPDRARSVTSPVIEQQLRHRSVRSFLDTPVSDAQLETIVTAAQRASTSSNLQAWSVIAIRDEDRRRRLSAALGGHSYIETAPVFLVWVADLARNARIVQAYAPQFGVELDTEIDTDADTAGSPASLGYIELTLVGAVDVGIAAQNALLAAESLGLGGVFVGGIRNNPAAVAAELGLPRHSFAMVGMSIGVPDPAESTGLKPRLPLSGVLHHEMYDAEAWRTATAQYEDDYRAYFETQGAPNRSWVRTIVSRLGKLQGLHGRETMRASLREQGFDSN